METVLTDGRSAVVVADSENQGSAVSWAAIIAGAVVALSVSLVLFALGSGFGLATVSPWPGLGASATTFTVVAAVWLVIVQWIASGVGGFVTGRLRTRWSGLHTHEVFFRDTAHGFLAWALATFIGVIAVASVTSTVVGGAARVAASQPAAAASAADSYDVDRLFRAGPGRPATPGDQAVRGEATRILAKGLTGGVPAADRAYLAQLVAAQTGLAAPDAQNRVDGVITDEKSAADAARKVASTTAIFTGVSMLVGAFIACVAAAFGGGVRDEY